MKIVTKSIVIKGCFPLSQIEQHQSLSTLSSKVPFSHALMIALSSTTSPCVSATFSLEMVLLKLRANGHCKAFSQLLTTVPRKQMGREWDEDAVPFAKMELIHQYLAQNCKLIISPDFERIPETSHYSSCHTSLETYTPFQIPP